MIASIQQKCDPAELDRIFYVVKSVVVRNHVLIAQLAFLGALCEFSRLAVKSTSVRLLVSPSGILDDADDEADADDLHGDVIADAERCTGDRDQQQGAASHTRGAAVSHDPIETRQRRVPSAGRR